MPGGPAYIAPPGGPPFTTPLPPTPEAQAQTREQQFAKVTSSSGIPTEGVTKEFLQRMLEQAGVDTSNSTIAGFVEFYPYTSPDATDEEKQSDLQLAQSMVQYYATQPEFRASGLTTNYSQALEASGFGPDYQFPTSPTAPRPIYGGGTVPLPKPGAVTQPETGWQLFPNGVLVDKSNPNPLSAVMYKPGSEAPGSSWWYDNVVTNWSAEQITTWRQRLVDMGYLPKGAEKTVGLDAMFRDALSSFHQYRYYNNGKAIPFDAAATQIHPLMTPKDEEAQIQNNVRSQFMAVFGDEPSDAELSSWTRFVVSQATQLQRQYMRRGVPEATALSNATTQAGEMAVNKLWNNPLGVEQRANTDANTKLHDGLQRAISATEGLL